ncbi:MAG: suppressor of fused domain protein [Gemmataceae bacterium]|nr:suppressor of fused domain protein [Gemmataceae bacterium]
MACEPEQPEPADDAPGWHAIDAACDRLYPDQPEPLHMAPALSPVFGGGLIYGISAYRAADPAPHWHLVTYGFSELHAKESDDPAVSGWGFELTFRLARGDEAEPPGWAFNFLTNLGAYVGRSGNPFGPGHHMDLNGPIALGSPTLIRGIVFAPDPDLGAIDTPNGAVEFLQVVGVTLDELAACEDWVTAEVVGVIRAANPKLVTDLGRRSVLADPAAAARVEAGIDRDGSQGETTYAAVVGWKVKKRPASARVAIGARAVDGLVRKLRSRLGHGRPFTLTGRPQSVRLEPAGGPGWEADGDTLAVRLPPAAVAAMRATLKPVRGEYTWPELPGVTVEVRPSEVTDAAGRVVEVIG